MGIVYRTVVDAPVDEVFSWFAKPGAISRLIPPWQPLTVVDEAASLRDGRAVLGLPGGVRWAAQHQPDAYQPPHRFVDQLDSFPLTCVLSWRHEHRFADLGGSTEVLDRVDTAVPQSLLHPTFRYRARQLADDLAALRRTGAISHRPLVIAVTGSSGTVGSALSALLSTAGHRVIRLVRHDPVGEHERRWQPDSPAPDLLEGIDAVVHLAGAGIAGRFTQAHRSAIRDSRIGPTRALAGLAADSGVGVFVCASAIGFYGPDRGDEPLTEELPRGTGFLAELVADWEAAAAAAAPNTRVVQVRTGLVLTPRGGILQAERPLFALGLGGRLGSGQQWLSWIGIDDLADIYHRAVIDRELSGPVNAVAPEPLRGKEFAAVLGRVMRRPAVLSAPRFAIEAVLGDQGAREFALASQRVSPGVLAGLGHHFRWPALDPALRHLLGRPVPGRD